MRWAAGWHGQEPAVRPAGAKSPDPGTRVWTVGWDFDQVRRHVHGETVATFVGFTGATPGELDAACSAVAVSRAAAAARLTGSGVVVIAGPERTVVVGDLAGLHRLWWLRREDQVVWSTSAVALADLMGIGPDLAMVAAELAAPAADAAARGTLFPDITPVPPGNALIIDADGPRHQRWSQHQDPMTLRRFAEAAEELHVRLNRAVGVRIAGAGPVSCDLSGGLDSSVLTCLAAARRPDVLALTYTDPVLGESDDVVLARKVAAQLGVRHEVAQADTVLHFGGLDGGVVPVTDAPALGAGMLAVKAAQFAPAVKAACRIHLTGRGGDNVADVIPGAYPSMATSGHPLAAVTRIAAWARARSRPLARTLAYGAAAALSDRRRHAAIAALADPARGNRLVNPLDPWALAAPAKWLTATGRAEVAERIAAAPTQNPETAALRSMGASAAADAQIAWALWGVDAHTPYLDTAVVEVCFGVPAHLRSAPGQYKPLLKAAVAGSVPEFLLARTTKTAFTGSAHMGLRAHASALRPIIAASRLADAGLLDAGAAATELDRAAVGVPGTLAGVHYLLAAELWLSAVERAAGTWWEPRR
jgi:asparagine synthase (glutamine-hydrolysing)